MISERAKQATSLPDMIWAISALRTEPTVDAAIYLARLDRRAPGWGRIALSGLLRFTLSLLLLYALLAIILFLARSLFQVLWLFVDLIHPGWALPVFSLATLAALFTLIRHAGLRARLAALLPPTDNFPLAVRRFVWLPLAGLDAVLLLATSAILLVFTWVPISNLLPEGVSRLIWLIRRWPVARAWVENQPDYWVPLGLGAALILLDIYLLLRQRSRTLVVFNLIALWLGGVALLAWYARPYDFLWPRPITFEWLLNLPGLVTSWWDLRPAAADLTDQLRAFLSHGYAPLWTATGLALLYPLGLGFPLTSLGLMPGRLLQAAVSWTRKRIQLRLSIGQALSDFRHRQRHRLGSDDYWTAYCRTHYQPYVLSYTRRSYFRWAAYAHCPVNAADIEVYTGIDCRLLHFDEHMSADVEPAGRALRYNALHWLRDGLAAHDQQPFDGLSIGQVDDHDVEEFVTEYRGRRRSLKRASVHIFKDHVIGENLARLLQAECENVYFDVNPAVPGSACSVKHRQRTLAAVQNARRQQLLRQWRGPFLVLLLLTFFLSFRPQLWALARQAWTAAQEVVAPTSVPATGYSTAARATATRAPASAPNQASGAATPTPPQPSPTPETVDRMPQRTIPAGSFLMGNPDASATDRTTDESPVHRVELAAYTIDAYEVSNAQYNLCVVANACTPPIETRSASHTSYYDNSLFANYPVIYITWDQADTYCRWVGRRLPTEAEWERAARWDASRQQAYTYPWGDDAPSAGVLNFDNNVGDTVAVSANSAGLSPIGAYQMAGNVWEWTADWYSALYYARTTQSNPAGPATGIERVLRGGAWDSTAFQVRATNRLEYNPAETGPNIGFRCADDH